MGFYIVSFVIISVFMIQGVFLACLSFFRNRSWWLLYFSIYLVWSLGFQWWGFLYSYGTGRENSFIFNISNMGELIFFCYLFIRVFPNGLLKMAVMTMSLLAIVFSISNILFIQ